MLRCSLLCLLLLFSFPVSNTPAQEFDLVRDRIEAALRDEQIPSLAIAVAKDGEILWEEGFGWANRERRVQATEHTPYSLASISKPITATGLMILVEDGEFDLDAAANRFLTDTQLVAGIGEAEAITIRQLANHTSGLPLHYQFFYEDESFSPPPFRESIRRYGIAMTKPGDHYQYANFGYGILDHLIATKSGQSYADFMREKVFLPLQMLQTTVDVPASHRHEAATRYAPDHTPLPHYHFDHPGASAVYSSAHDLARFGMFHLGDLKIDRKPILSERSLSTMQEPTAHIGGNRHYGVGWFIDKDEHGLHTVSHSGGMGGVRTRLTLVPKEGIVVAALCNYRSDLPMRMTREILAALLPDYGERMRKADTHEPNSQPGMPGCPVELVGYWAGSVETYRGARRLELWAHSNGDIHVRMAGGLKKLLNASRLNNGVLSGVFDGDVDTPDANRRPYRLHFHLRLDEDRLYGRTTAMTIAHQRAGNALSYWTDLQRVDESPDVLALFNGHDLSGWQVADRFDFARHGSVRVEDGVMHVGAGKPGSGVFWNGGPYRYDYELTLEAKRVAGSDFFAGITFPVENDYLTMIIGGWGGGVVGISNLDGMSAVENETTNYREFEQDRWYRIRLRVTKQDLQAWIDDEQMIDVEIANRKKAIWWEMEPMRPLGIATWYTHAALRDIRLKRIDP